MAWTKAQARPVCTGQHATRTGPRGMDGQAGPGVDAGVTWTQGRHGRDGRGRRGHGRKVDEGWAARHVDERRGHEEVRVGKTWTRVAWRDEWHGRDAAGTWPARCG